MLFPNTSITSPITISIMNNIVSKIAFILIYKYDAFSSPLVLYMFCIPFVNANNPLPADHIVNMIEIDIVPIDFEYTS